MTVRRPVETLVYEAHKTKAGGVPLLPYGEVVAVLDELPVALRIVRRVRNLTLEEAAREAGISRSIFDRLEDGAGCSLHTLRKVLIWLDRQPETELVKARR